MRIEKKVRVKVKVQVQGFLFLGLYLCLLLFPSPASARLNLTGLADLEYTDFHEKNQSAEVEASQFKQRYEVGYSTGGTIIDRGIGNYAISLRYQYLKADTSFDSGDLGSGDLHASGHTLLWDGSINIAPKKVPFKLNLYSGETNPLLSSSVAIPGTISRMAPDAINRMDEEGLSRTSGLNLHFEFGGKKRRGNGGNGNGGNGNGGNGNGGNGNGGNGNGNGNGGNGNGNGNGNGFIRLSLPKGIIDYAKIITDKKDVYESTDDIRFSLNDKKNWFHYNWKRYDNLLGGGDYVQEQFQIGNVNRNGGRGWFYLNNWLMLSTDASYQRVDFEDAPGTNDTYSVNMFANAFRSWWDASFYGAYIQTLDNEGYRGESRISLPLYVSITPNNDTSLAWKSYFTQEMAWDMDKPDTLSKNEEKTTKDIKEAIEDISSTNYHLTKQDLTLKSRYMISKEMAPEEGSHTSQTLGLSLNSSPGKSYSYGMGYTVNSVKDDDAGEIADDSISQTFSINGRYAVSQRIGISAGQTVSLSSDRDSAYPDSRSYSSNIGANMYIHRTLSMDLSGNKSYTENIGANHSETIGFSGSIRFTPASWAKISSLNNYSETRGENPYQKVKNSIFGTVNHMEIKVNRSFSSRTNIEHSIEDESFAMRKSTILKIKEGFEYIRFIERYKARTLYSINGSINYTENKTTIGHVSTGASSQGASLGFNHQPYRHLSWGISGNYNVSNNSAPSQSGSVYVAIPFSMLNISANYSFMQDEERDLDAQKLLVKVSKIF